MKRNITKLTSMLLSIVILSSLYSVAFAVSNPTSTTPNNSTNAVGTFAYNGKTETLLGAFSDLSTNSPTSYRHVKGNWPCKVAGYFECDDWKVYDKGITKKWVYLSKLHFITSVARGMAYKIGSSFTIKSTFSANFGANIPDAALSPIKSTFGLTASASKTLTKEITFTGPSNGYNSRDFYYKNGRHRHVIKLVKEHWVSEGVGVVSTQTYYRTIDLPAIKHYSIDTNVK